MSNSPPQAPPECQIPAPRLTFSMRDRVWQVMAPGFGNREVKHDVYGKRQTAKMKLLPSVFSSLYSRIKIFVFAVNSKRHFSIFV